MSPTHNAAGSQAPSDSAQRAPQGTERRPLLRDDDLTTLQQRWTELEERFIDDPADTIRRAEHLIDDVIERIRAQLIDRRSMLRGPVESLDDATTEQLRQTLHQYEQFFTQLTGVPAPAGWHDEEHAGRPTAHGRPSFTNAGQPGTQHAPNEDTDIEKGARS